MNQVQLNLGTVLEEGEDYISGKEYEKRMPENVLGFQQAVWLVEHQDEFPELMALLGKIYIDFTGLVVVHGDGRRSYPCLEQGGGRWILNWYWIGGGLNPGGRIAVSRNIATRDLEPKNSCTLPLGSLESRIEKLEKTVEQLVARKNIGL